MHYGTKPSVAIVCDHTFLLVYVFVNLISAFSPISQSHVWWRYYPCGRQDFHEEKIK